MKKQISAKRALLMSALSLLLCVSMLVGSTFAWFTDSAVSGSNIIKSGNLDVALEDANGNSLEGQMIQWKTSDNRAQDQILWEPGCTYDSQEFYVANKGSLNLKFKLTVNGIDGDAKLLEVIDFTAVAKNQQISFEHPLGMVTATTDVDLINGTVYDTGLSLGGQSSTVTVTEYILKPGEKMGPIVLSGHMDEAANNDYQGLTIEGIGISVVATQAVGEHDSFTADYDAAADYINLPQAEIVTNGPSDISETMIDVNHMAFGSDFQLPDDLELDASYDFIAPSVVDPNYADWRVDYVVSIDTDIDKDSLVLAGAYEAAFGDTWVAFSNPIDITAGEEVPLLGSFYGPEHSFTYDVICNEVKEFKCGVANIDVPAGAKLTVALKIFEVGANGVNTGLEYTIAVVEHQF